MGTITTYHETGQLGTHERWDVDDGGNVTLTTTQNCDPILDALHDARDLPKGKEDGLRYVGSVPLVLAEVWASECGANVGTREFADYAKKKLQDFDNRRLLVSRF